MRMSPLAFIQCVIFGWLSGELEQVRRYGAREMTGNRAMALAVNGMIAFGLNVVSFSANKKAGVSICVMELPGFKLILNSACIRL
jgi:hypothetical protein